MLLFLLILIDCDLPRFRIVTWILGCHSLEFVKQSLLLGDRVEVILIGQLAQIVLCQVLLIVAVPQCVLQP